MSIYTVMSFDPLSQAFSLLMISFSSILYSLLKAAQRSLFIALGQESHNQWSYCSEYTYIANLRNFYATDNGCGHFEEFLRYHFVLLLYRVKSMQHLKQ